MDKSLCTSPQAMSVSASSSPCNHSYRSAIALNNMGVTLLERNCYQQAGATFKAAVSLLRTCCTSIAQGVQPSPASEHELELHLARQRLAHPQSDLRRNEVHDHNLETISNAIGSKDINALLEDKNVLGNQRTFFALRIEDYDCEQEILSAILLLNFGVSYAFLAKTFRSDSPNERKYLNGAARLSRISHSLIIKASLQPSSSTSTSSSSPLHAMMEHVLKLVVLQTLVQALAEARRDGEAAPFVTLLRQVQWTMVQSTHVMTNFQQGRSNQDQDLAPAA